jgi:hypothetical protein
LLVDWSPACIVSRFSMVMRRFSLAASPVSIESKNGPIGWRTSAMSLRSIAMPTSAEMMLLEADLMLAGRAGPAPLKYRSKMVVPERLTSRLCRRGSCAASRRIAAESRVAPEDCAAICGRDIDRQTTAATSATTID